MNTDAKSDLLAGETSSPLHFEVTLSAEVTSISPAVGWIMRLVGELEYTSGKEFEIEMAFREALANAVVHGCKADPPRKLNVRLRAIAMQGSPSWFAIRARGSTRIPSLAHGCFKSAFRPRPRNFVD